MRPLTLGSPSDLPGVVRALREIENASFDSIETVADAYTISGTFTETRTLNVTTPSTANLAAVLATIITDLKKRGAKRT